MSRPLVAIALLAAGCSLNTGESGDGSAPVVVITAPAGDQVQGTVVFSATVVDDRAVELVEFFAGQTLLLADGLPPYQTNWATVNFPDGPIVLKVRARDFAGNSREATKNVTIDNSPN